MSRDQVDNAKKYLLRYGYLDKFSVGEEELKDSIARLQYFANLKQTGTLDAATLKQMTIPRCGLGDPKIKIQRSRRYVHQGSYWRKNFLTWRLEGRGRTLDRETIRKVMKKAFTYWSDITNLDFKEVNGNDPDIWVKFVTRYHNDPYAFDGRGGTLAHAFYPHNNVGLSGDVHFDDDEDYTYKSPRGRNLLWVATHEIGHSIGLDHSNVREAVMYPWYTKYKPGFKLQYDDILGIQSLYGSRSKLKTTTTTTTTKTTTTTTTTTPKTTRTTTTKGQVVPHNKKCPASTITAVYYNTYARLIIGITKEEKLYFIRPAGGIRYGPVEARSYLPSTRIPGSIDAAYDTKILENRPYTIFYSGTKYYIYQHFRYRSGPHSIYGNIPGDKNPLRLDLPTWVKKIDAVMTWNGNGRTYYFAGEYYWRYNGKRKTMDSGYPKRIVDAWKGLPRSIDAAYSDKDKTFFISGTQYYLFDDKAIRVKPGYPQHVGRQWLNCGGKSSKVGGIGGLSIGEAHAEKGVHP